MLSFLRSLFKRKPPALKVRWFDICEKCLRRVELSEAEEALVLKGKKFMCLQCIEKMMQKAQS